MFYNAVDIQNHHYPVQKKEPQVAAPFYNYVVQLSNNSADGVYYTIHCLYIGNYNWISDSIRT